MKRQKFVYTARAGDNTKFVYIPKMEQKVKFVYKALGDILLDRLKPSGGGGGVDNHKSGE